MIGHPAPTIDQLRTLDGLGPAQRAVCIALVQHGINPDDVPWQHDAVTADGYLVVTTTPSTVLPDGSIEVARLPWPDRTAWRDVRRAANTRA